MNEAVMYAFIITAYLALLLLIGFITGRRTKSVEDFYIGGGRISLGSPHYLLVQPTLARLDFGWGQASYCNVRPDPTSLDFSTMLVIIIT